MATRREAPTRLVEGREYNLALPRQTIRLARNKTLVSPQYERTYISQAGQLVPVGEPRLAARQKVQVGSLVRVEANRRSRIAPSVGQHDPVVHPGSSPDNPAYYETWTSRVDGHRLFVVQAVSACGKFVRVLPLLTTSSRVFLHWGSLANKFIAERSASWYIDENGESRYGAQPMDQAYFNAAVSGTWLDAEVYGDGESGSTSRGSLLRVSAIKQHIDPQDLPGFVLPCLRYRAAQTVREALFARLAEMESARRGPVSAFRLMASAHTARYVKDRKRIAKSVAIHLREAGVAVRAGQTGQASPHLNLAYDTIINAYPNWARGQSLEAQASAQRMLARFCERHGMEPLRRAAACEHFHTGSSVMLMRTSYGDMGEYCPDCAAAAITVLTRDGQEVQAHPQISYYTWSDGTRRMIREPDVIGHRHSGKHVVGFVPPISGAQRGSYITLGLELEMQATRPDERMDMARALSRKLKDANLLDAQTLRKYLHFEDDGSTGPGGFEMVTGYTDLATHGKLLYALLTDNGAPAWQGKLRSHDAKGGSCGIHVHVQKPTSLIHASKIRYFINAAASAQLVRDVARRYNDTYAQINNRITERTPEMAAVELVKQVKGRSDGRTRPQHASMAMQRINERSRYEALNFQNANTLEFRIFRGTLLFNSVMACLEFTHAVWHFCRFSPATKLTPDNFIAWINHPDNRRDTRNLRVYLKRKGWDCYVPKENKAKPQPTVAAPDTTTPTTDTGVIDSLYDDLSAILDN